MGPAVPTVDLVRDTYKASLQFTQLHQDWDNSGHAQNSSKLLVNLRANKSLNLINTSFVGILVLN